MPNARVALYIITVVLSLMILVFIKYKVYNENDNPTAVIITRDNAAKVTILDIIDDHRGPVWTVVFSPDGKLLASCGEDGQVLVRRTDSLSKSSPMGNFSRWIVGLAFNPNSKNLAYGCANGFSGSVGPIGIWNIEKNNQERTMNDHKGGCWSLDFQESTGLLVSGSFDGTVKLWNPQTSELLNTLTGHTGAVLSVDFNPHQNLIASSGTDYTVRLWNSKTGELVSILRGHTGNVGYVKFSPDGLTMASSADDGVIRLWNVATSKLIWSVEAKQSWVNCVNFNPDGSLLVTCGHDGSVVLRDASTGAELKRLEGHQKPVLRGEFNPSGTILATASWDNTVRIWGIKHDSS